MTKPVVPPQLFQSQMRNFRSCICDKASISHLKMIVTTCCSYSLTWEPPTCPTCLFSISVSFLRSAARECVLRVHSLPYLHHSSDRFRLFLSYSFCSL